MVKKYHYMNGVNYDVFKFGVLIRPLDGIVESEWLAPEKYHSVITEILDDETGEHPFSAAGKPVKWSLDMKLVFTQTIDFGDMDEVTRLKAILTRGVDGEINDAAYRVSVLKKRFQHYVRAEYYKNEYNMT